MLEDSPSDDAVGTDNNHHAMYNNIHIRNLTYIVGRGEYVVVYIDNIYIYPAFYLMLNSYGLHALGLEGVPLDLEVNLNGQESAPNDLTALTRAAQSGNANAVAVLMMHAQKLGRGDYVYTLDGQGLSALHWAVCRGHTEVVHVMKYLDPLVLLQRTSNGLLPIKLVPSKGQKKALLTPLLLSKRSSAVRKNKNVTLTVYMWSMCTVDSLISAILLASMLFSLYVVATLHALSVDGFTSVSHLILQCMVWYFYLNTLLAPIPGLPEQCTSMYRQSLKRMYNFCLTDKISANLVSSNNTETAQSLRHLNASICHICQAVCPFHARHVYSLGYCALDFDHYCIFMKTNICRENFLWFFGFLLAMTVEMIWFVYSVHMYEAFIATRIQGSIVYIFKIYTLYAWFCMAGFTMCQIGLLRKGRTMNEYMQQTENQSSEKAKSESSSDFDKLLVEERLNWGDTLCTARWSPLTQWMAAVVRNSLSCCNESTGVCSSPTSKSHRSRSISSARLTRSNSDRYTQAPLNSGRPIRFMRGVEGDVWPDTDTTAAITSTVVRRPSLSGRTNGNHFV